MRKLNSVLNDNRKFLTFFGAMILDGIVFISLVVVIAILYFL
jgi:hypothetical protein